MAPVNAVTVPAIRARKGGDRIVCVTAYDAPTAAILEEAGVDVVLVGDSVSNVLLGYDSTIPVTMDEMVHHVRAVRRGMKRALLVADMPFMSYQASKGDALRNAGRFLKEGADAVKLEGGQEVLDAVAALVANGIPVMGHVGLTPQRAKEYGGYRAQGKDASSAFRIWRAAKALDKAGVFSIVLESVPRPLARKVTEACSAPTIGIGAGSECDGQVLVFNDLVGLTPTPPRFAKSFAKGREIFLNAVKDYSGAVRAGDFPEHGSGVEMAKDEFEELESMIASASEKA
jgi:3-methyl-2-oxobutanoate hydroxymethyltransferase